MDRARPTVRCLRHDLHLAMPEVDIPLDEIDHPLLSKTNEQFFDPDTPHERIRAIDDNIMFKVKIQRWRGAVWTDEPQVWLVVAGQRESGSPDDFYAALAADTVAARKGYNATHGGQLTTDAYSAHLLPNVDDAERYQLEAGARFLRLLSTTVHTLLRASLRDGREHTADLATFRLGIQIRADHGHETYVAVRVSGSVPANLIMLVFDNVPGCDHTGWFPEDALPDRLLHPGEYVWSNIMDPSAAAKLLDIDDS